MVERANESEESERVNFAPSNDSQLSINVINMNQLRAIILIILIVISTSSDPQIQLAQKVQYLQQLLQQHNQIDKQMKEIQISHQEVNINLGLSSQQKYQQRVLASGIQDAKSMLLQAYRHTFRNRTLRSWDCPTENQNQKLHEQLNYINQSSSQFEASTGSRVECQGDTQLITVYGISAEGLQKELGLGCSVSHIPAMSAFTHYSNNNTDRPWIFGNLTVEEWNDNIVELQTLYSAQQCPQYQPFVNAFDQCMTCPQGTIFDLSSKQCEQCPSYTLYHSQTHSCKQIAFLRSSNLGPENGNYVGFQPSTHDRLQPCPPAFPYFDGQQCIDCSFPSYFNLTSLQCSQCPAGQVFLLGNRQCGHQKTIKDSNLDSSSNYVGVPVGPIAYSQTQTCPQDKPFSNGTQCFECKLPHFYNFETNLCQSCPAGFKFENKERRCQGQGTVSLLNSNLLKSRNFVGRVPLYSGVLLDCQDSSPYFDGNQCINCELPEYFNFDTLTCQLCSSEMHFNTALQMCLYDKQDHYTNLKATNIYYNGDYSGVENVNRAVKSSNSYASECHISRPYYSRRLNQCIDCPFSAPLFDFRRNQCIKCPPGSQFSTNSHICLTESISPTLERMIMNSS